jgi:serine/threonine protein kinase
VDHPASPVPGLPTVAGYEVLGELGRGGMGVVYKARHLGLRRLVALKMLRGAEYAEPEQLARFRREAEAVAHLQHPNIVQIYDIGEQNGLPYLSLEFVDGMSLAQFLGGRPLPPDRAAALAETLARAIHHAHQRGIVHRDLKPGNILLERRKEDGGRRKEETLAAPEPSSFLLPPSSFLLPKITDFGLAKHLDEEQGNTRSGVILGTPAYMAPEQAAGRGRDVGPHTDGYALGAVLYEMLTGRPPFAGSGPLSVLERVMNDEPVPPSRLHPRCPRDLETICLKAMAKDPARRYSSALALAQDLERFRAGEPILGRREGFAGRLWRRVRRRPATTASYLALVLLAALAVAYGVRQAGSARRVRELAQEFDAGLETPAWTAEHLGHLRPSWPSSRHGRTTGRPGPGSGSSSVSPGPSGRRSTSRCCRRRRLPTSRGSWPCWPRGTRRRPGSSARPSAAGCASGSRRSTSAPPSPRPPTSSPRARRGRPTTPSSPRRRRARRSRR